MGSQEDTGEATMLDHAGTGVTPDRGGPMLTKAGERLKVKRGIVPRSSIQFKEQAQVLVHLVWWPERTPC